MPWVTSMFRRVTLLAHPTYRTPASSLAAASWRAYGPSDRILKSATLAAPVSGDQLPPLALLIDGDQVPADSVAGLLERLGKQWTVDERICVRNWRSTKDQQAWRDVASEHGIRLFQRDPARVGKNATDIELAVITIDLLHAGRRAFCLVSGDTDFVPVIERLKRASAHIEVVQPVDLRLPDGSRRGARGRRPQRTVVASAAPDASPSPPKPSSRPAPAKPSSRAAPAQKPAPVTPSRAATAAPTEAQLRFAKHVRRGIDQLKKDGHHERGWVSVNRLGSALGALNIRREDHGFAKSRTLNQILEDLGFRVEQTETGAYQVSIPASARS